MTYVFFFSFTELSTLLASQNLLFCYISFCWISLKYQIEFGKTLAKNYLNSDLNCLNSLQSERVRVSPGIFEYIMGPSKLAPSLQDFLRVKET